MPRVCSAIRAANAGPTTSAPLSAPLTAFHAALVSVAICTGEPVQKFLTFASFQTW